MAVPDLLRLRMIDEAQTNPKNIYNGMWFASFHLYRISSLQCHHSKFDAISRNGEFEKRDYERFFFFFFTTAQRHCDQEGDPGPGHTAPEQRNIFPINQSIIYSRLFTRNVHMSISEMT